MIRPLALLTLILAVLLAPGPRAAAQDTTATGIVRAHVHHDAAPVADAVVRAGRIGAMTDSTGTARLVLPAGPHDLIVSRLGFAAETLAITVRAGEDTTLDIALGERAAAIARVIVTATRTERRIEDEPLRVEVLAGEDISEKNETRPADIRNLLVEMSGVRVQTTAPSLGAATVRVHGLPGRYTLMLSDGLPLYGAQSSGFSLVEVPPLDLRQVEVIKGAASALYGPSALGGVVDLVSRRPPDTSQVLANRTTHDGTDVLGFAAPRLSSTLGLTMLGGIHDQRVADPDGDAWSDIPGFRRAELRPRLFWSDHPARSLMVTAGVLAEDRSGGAMGSAAPGGGLADSLDTRHGDVGVVGRWQLRDGVALGLRASAEVTHRRRLTNGTVERERQGTSFAEGTATVAGGRSVLVAGVAWQQDAYANRDVPRFDRTISTPALFAQETYDAAPWLAATLDGRCDASSVYGTICSPRLSLLARAGAAVSVRLSAGGGWLAPMALNDQTEPIGLARVVLPRPLEAERARTAALDVTATRGPLQVNATLFADRVQHPLGLAPVAGDTTGLAALVNAPGALRTSGGELFAVFDEEPVIVTAYVAATRSRERSPETGAPREAPLVPRTAAGLDAAWEEDETGSYLAAELFHTGIQSLEDDPYRARSRPYTTLGILAAQRVGRATLFASAENLTDVRLSRYEPVVRPSPGLGGRWTVDAWAPMEGRTVNAGVRWAF